MFFSAEQEVVTIMLRSKTAGFCPGKFLIILADSYGLKPSPRMLRFLCTGKHQDMVPWLGGFKKTRLAAQGGKAPVEKIIEKKPRTLIFQTRLHQYFNQFFEICITENIDA